MAPLNLGETLDASIKIVRTRWRTLATVMIVIALPVQIADVLIISATTDVYEVGTGFSNTAGTQTAYGDEGAYVAGQVAMLALSFLSYLLGTVACYRAVADTHLGRPTSARASLEYAGSRLGATLWLTIVLIIGLVAGFVAFILPFFWLAIAWSVAYPVMLVEGTGGVAALRRSFRLTEGRWWATCGRMLVAYILVAVIATVAALVFVAPATAILDDTSFGALVLEHVGDFIASLVTPPFLAAVATLVYFDLRLRKEGVGPAGMGAAAPERRDAFGTAGSWAPPVAPEPQRPPSPEE